MFCKMEKREPFTYEELGEFIKASPLIVPGIVVFIILSPLLIIGGICDQEKELFIAGCVGFIIEVLTILVLKGGLS